MLVSDKFVEPHNLDSKKMEKFSWIWKIYAEYFEMPLHSAHSSAVRSVSLCRHGDRKQ